MSDATETKPAETQGTDPHVRPADMPDKGLVIMGAILGALGGAVGTYYIGPMLGEGMIYSIATGWLWIPAFGTIGGLLGAACYRGH